MLKPYIICHMMTALDGRITGSFMKSDAIQAPSEEYEDINATFEAKAWLCGRVTSEEQFTFHKRPVLDEQAATVPGGDYVACPDANNYYVTVDPSGKLGWETNTLHYENRKPAHIIEIVTHKASNAYLAFLRKMEISYLIAGDDALDCSIAVEKLRALFNIETLVLSGGGSINWSFLAAGLVDELSLVIAPLADGAHDTPTLFEAASHAPGLPVAFALKSTEVCKGDSVWLRYTVQRNSR